MFEAYEEQLKFDFLIITRDGVILTSIVLIGIELANGDLGIHEQNSYNLGSFPPNRPMYVSVSFDIYVSVLWNEVFLSRLDHYIIFHLS